MKKLYILLFALVAINGIRAQWVLQNSGTTEFLFSVYFTDSNTGFVVGSGGIILKTTNGGLDWSTQNSGTTNTLYSIFFTDANTGYAVGGEQEEAVILKTINGGSAWETMYTEASPGAFWLNSVYFTDPYTGYVVGVDQDMNASFHDNILKTSNGGTTWTNQFSEAANNMLNSVCFINANKGYTVGRNFEGGVILKTTNGGIDWTTQNSGTANTLNSVYFIDEDIGYAAGSSGTILKTTDGGMNWTVQNSGTDRDMISICFINAETGYIVGGFSNVLKTMDGGNLWTIQPTGISNWWTYFYSVKFIDANTGYIVGDEGTIIKTINGGGMGLNDNTFSSNQLKLFPNPSKNKITISLSALKGNIQLSIFNVSAEKVLERQLTDNETQIDISALPQGVYFVRVQDGKTMKVEKMIKQ